MRFLLFSILFALALSSCENRYVVHGRHLYELYFNKNLKDPSSFKVYNEKYTIEDNGITVNWELDYGAKNGFGAMDREQVEFTTTLDYLFINGNMYKADDLK